MIESSTLDLRTRGGMEILYTLLENISQWEFNFMAWL